MSDTIRDQLHKQIDALPEELVEQIADFTLFVMARKQIVPAYVEWEQNQWQSSRWSSYLAKRMRLLIRLRTLRKCSRDDPR